MVRPCALSALVGLACLTACTPDEGGPLPDFEWEGGWVTILGYERAPEETCAGTFAYLDGYTGALAGEFGVTSAPVGDYRWYSRDLFSELAPCGHPAGGCTGLNGIFTDMMPIEHELVHLVHHKTTLCPIFLGEGLAEFYGTTSLTPASFDLTRFLENPSATSIPSSDYPLAGALVAFVIEEHGLGALLEICERSGVTPTRMEFDEAVAATLGMSVDRLAEEFTSYECSYAQYRSKVFECGLEPSIEIGDQAVELHLTLDCADKHTIGPRVSEIWTLAKIRVLESDVYVIGLEDESGMIVDGEVGLDLTPCQTCADAPLIHRFAPDQGPIFSPVQLRATDYIVKVRGKPDVVKQLTLNIER